MKAFFSIILAVALSISTAMAKHGGHGGHRGHGGYHGKHGKHFKLGIAARRTQLQPKRAEIQPRQIGKIPQLGWPQLEWPQLERG